MEEINLRKIRGQWIKTKDNIAIDGGDDTIASIKLVAEKVNELVIAFNLKL